MSNFMLVPLAALAQTINKPDLSTNSTPDIITWQCRVRDDTTSITTIDTGLLRMLKVIQ